jgi:nucleolar pre-ribosomal-associated protein 2
MYLVLMQYVKLQLEGGVPRPVQEALEPALNSIFDITSAESRKILNDAMNASGRAILREMFKRYTKFGKWSGV